MIIEINDLKIEIKTSGNGSPPGYTGMSVASPSTWLRVNDGNWIRSPYRSQYRLLEDIRSFSKEDLTAFIKMINENN